MFTKQKTIAHIDIGAENYQFEIYAYIMLCILRPFVLNYNEQIIRLETRLPMPDLGT